MQTYFHQNSEESNSSFKDCNISDEDSEQEEIDLNWVENLLD